MGVRCEPAIAREGETIEWSRTMRGIDPIQCFQVLKKEKDRLRQLTDSGADGQVSGVCTDTLRRTQQWTGPFFVPPVLEFFRTPSLGFPRYNIRTDHIARCRPFAVLRRTAERCACVYRAPCGGGRGKEEPLSAIATVLQAAPGDDGLPPPGPPRHTSAA